MINNLKLSSVFWIFVALMLITGIAIITSAFIVDKNVSVINDTWHEYQTDRSEKARLESALRSAIGYGGMIHDFKNYVLRKEELYHHHVESHIGAANAILHQYSDQKISAAEEAAIEDIEHTLGNYLNALRIAKKLIKQQDSTTQEINRAVILDDSSALRGLITLRHEMRADISNHNKPSKARIVADLRAAIGYGGMIHLFKDYVLRQNNADIENITHKFQQASIAIEHYRKLTPNHSENIALNDIELTLQTYANKLKTIQTLAAKNTPPQVIDNSIKVNEEPILRGLHILDREINAKVANDSERVTSALQLVKQTILYGVWATIIVFIFVILIVAWLFHSHIIAPVASLTRNMKQLANNKLDIETSNHLQQNEVGEMTRAIIFFKNNMMKQKEAEDNLAITNKEMKQQLQDIEALREHAEEQTSKALSLADGLSAARESAEKAMSRAETEHELISSILNTVRDGIITIDAEGIIKVFNPGAEDIFGYRAHDVIGENISMLMPEPHRSAHDNYLKIFKDGHSTRNQKIPLEQLALRKNGETFPVEVTLNTMQIDGKTKTTGLLRDITERKKAEEEIKRMAMTDPLTGLANRNRYTQRLDEMKKQSIRFNTPFALIQIDLDKFKPVNDTYGHPAGDAVLQQVAKTLLSSCRDVDTVARLGGDEFSIIVNGIKNPEDVIISAERIIKQISLPIQIKDHSIQIGASIGISYYPDDSTDIEELIRMADEALYIAKREGRNTYRVYKQIH